MALAWHWNGEHAMDTASAWRYGKKKVRLSNFFGRLKVLWFLF